MAVRKEELEKGGYVMLQSRMPIASGAAVHRKLKRARIIDVLRAACIIEVLDEKRRFTVPFNQLEPDNEWLEKQAEREREKRARIARDHRAHVQLVETYKPLTFSLSEKLESSDSDDDTHVHAGASEEARRAALAQIEALKAASAPTPAVVVEQQQPKDDARDEQGARVEQHERERTPRVFTLPGSIAAQSETMGRAIAEQMRAITRAEQDGRERREQETPKRARPRPPPAPPESVPKERGPVAEMQLAEVEREIARCEEDETALLEMLGPLEERLKQLRRRRKALRAYEQPVPLKIPAPGWQRAGVARPAVRHRAPTGEDVLDPQIARIVAQKEGR